MLTATCPAQDRHHPAQLRSVHQLNEATLARQARHPVRVAALTPALAIALQLGVDAIHDARGWPKSVEQALAVGLPSAAARTLSLR